MTLFFKILLGYNQEREVQITAEELEKAYGIFLLGGRSIFSGGAVDGKLIHAIVPDWHRLMGWNPGYRLGPDDWEEIRSNGSDVAARGLLSGAQARVQGYITAGRPELIGSPTSGQIEGKQGV